MRGALAEPGLPGPGLYVAGYSVAQSHIPCGIEYSSEREPSFMSVKWECSHNYVLGAGTSGEATILLG